MTKAIWEGKILAESDDCVMLEGNDYFPPESIQKEHLRSSDTTTVCSWKGIANYYHIDVGGKTNQDAAWYYPEPKEAAKQIKHYVAFWKGVHIESDR